MSKKSNSQKKKSGSTWEKIEWEDHFSQPVIGWATDHVLDPVVVTSVGYTVSETKKVVCMAQNFSEIGHAGNTMNIIKKCIISRKKL